MQPFDLSMPAWLRTDPPEPSTLARHSGHTSLTGPDATPKPYAPALKAHRRSQRRAPYRPPNPDLEGLRSLAALTSARGYTSLAAAQTLYAPELLEKTHA